MSISRHRASSISTYSETNAMKALRPSSRWSRSLWRKDSHHPFLFLLTPFFVSFLLFPRPDLKVQCSAVQCAVPDELGPLAAGSRKATHSDERIEAQGAYVSLFLSFFVVLCSFETPEWGGKRGLTLSRKKVHVLE